MSRYSAVAALGAEVDRRAVAEVAPGGHAAPTSRSAAASSGERAVGRAVVDDDDLAHPARRRLATHASSAGTCVVVDDDCADSRRRRRSALAAQAVSSATSAVDRLLPAPAGGRSPTGAGRRCRARSSPGGAPGGAARARRSRSARPAPGRRRQDRRTSAGEAVPGRRALVGHVEDARRCLPSASSTTVPARSPREVGLPRWSSTKRSGSPARGEAQHGLDHVRPRACRTPMTVRTIVWPRIELALAAELGAPVDRERVRVVPLDVRAGRGAVEDVVGRQVAHVRADERGPPRRRGGCRGRSRDRRGRGRTRRRRPP